MLQTLVPDPFLNWVNNPKQPLDVRNSFKNKIFWKKIIKNPLKDLPLFFLSNPLPFNDKIVMKNKRGLELLTSRTSGYKTSSEKFRYLWCITWPSLMTQHKVVFELFQKLHLLIYASQFMTLWIFPLSFVLLNLKSVERKGKNTKIWISREQKELFRLNKKHFL